MAETYDARTGEPVRTVRTTSEAQAAVIEIVERTDRPDPFGVIVVNEVRINGQPVLCSSDDGVTVHEISTLGDGIAKVTLTLYARRVLYGSEPAD